MLFPQFHSFLLVCSFQFSPGSAVPSIHFVYRLPGYPTLPIFHWVSNLIYVILYVFCLFVYSVFRKIKNRKAAGLDEISQEVWKTRQFDDILRHCNAVYNQNLIERWIKGCILPFPKKGDFGLAKNYRGITLTSMAAKIYNALLRNHIEPKIDNIHTKKKMASEEIDPRPHKY